MATHSGGTRGPEPIPPRRGFAYIPPTPHTRAEELFDEQALAAVQIVRDFPLPDAWTLGAHPHLLAAMFFRAADTLESVVQLRRLGNDADAVALGRVLFEHVATYCWLLGDPSPPDRFNSWWKKDVEHERKLLREIAALSSDPGRLGVVEATDVFADYAPRDAAPAMLKVAGVAEHADRAWLDAVKDVAGNPGLPSLSTLYTRLFRIGSMFVHPFGAFIYSHVETLGPRRFGLQSPGKILHTAIYFRMLSCFSYGLAVNHLVWGWPPADAVRRLQVEYEDPLDR